MDNPIETNSAPTVSLGGRIWPIPLLAARQNKIIDPLILSVLPLFSEWQTNKRAALSKLDAAHYAALQEIAFHAILRAHPEITREQFLDLPVSLPELIGAFAVIAQQTGIFERAGPGEAGAGTLPPNAPTGTVS